MFYCQLKWFEEFRNNSLKNYGLCPIHYSRTPVVNWDAMFNMKKIELELISDVDINLSFEKSMREGVYYNSKRYSKASDKYLKSYDPKQESKYIINLGANKSCNV